MLVTNHRHRVTSQKSKGLAPVCAFLRHAAVGCVAIAVELSVSICRLLVSIEWNCLGCVVTWDPQDREKE
jgi:hypothetical protein